MRPIVFQENVSLAAGQTINNALEQSRLVQSPMDGFLSLAINGSAVGLRVQMIVGSDEVVTDSAVNGFNRSIEEDKDFLLRRIGTRAGERVTLKISNPTAGALTADLRVLLRPVRG